MCSNFTNFDTLIVGFEGTLSYVNKVGYTATPVACGWAGAIIEVTPSFG